MAMTWNRAHLDGLGFAGFVPFADLPSAGVPRGPGVYAITRPSIEDPQFLVESRAGHFKGKDPSVPISTLEAAWVPDTCVLYLGKAATGKTGRSGLNKRLEAYRRFGAGEPVGHWGGRYVFQLADADQLVVAWKATTHEDPRDVEASLIQDFVRAYGKRPFANLKD
jgi:hypothetical protein